MDHMMPNREEFLANMRPGNIADIPEHKEATCTICFGDLADNAEAGECERVVFLHGTHYYGENCIRDWLKEHDSCPCCRQQLFRSVPNISGYPNISPEFITRLESYVRYAGAFIWRIPSTRAPIEDFSILSLCRDIDTLVRELEATRSEQLLAYAGDLRNAGNDIMDVRLTWYATNASYVRRSGYSHYASIMPRASVQRLATWVQINGHSLEANMTEAITQRFFEEVERAIPGQPLHIATHPLSTAIMNITRNELLAMHNTQLTVQELRNRLREAITENHLLRSAMSGETAIPYCRALWYYCEDVVNDVCHYAFKSEEFRRQSQEGVW